MILPIVAYGDTILKKVATDIPENNSKLSELVENMWETMYNAKGIGLAGPQVNKSLRIFIVDTVQLEKKADDFGDGIKKVFINAQIVEYDTNIDKHEEGCLSIPEINAEVERPSSITIEFFDENFKKHTQQFHGFNARVIQHEYDHIEGILFTDKINPLKKRLLQKKLDKISKGKITSKYKMKFST